MVCVDLPSKKLTSSLAGSEGSAILAVPSMKLTVPLALKRENTQVHVIYLNNTCIVLHCLAYICICLYSICALNEICKLLIWIVTELTEAHHFEPGPYRHSECKWPDSILLAETGLESLWSHTMCPYTGEG